MVPRLSSLEPDTGPLGEDENVEEVVELSSFEDKEDSQLMSCLGQVECIEDIDAAAFAKKLPIDVESSSLSFTNWRRNVEHIDSYVTICFSSSFVPSSRATLSAIDAIVGMGLVASSLDVVFLSNSDCQ